MIPHAYFLSYRVRHETQKNQQNYNMQLVTTFATVYKTVEFLTYYDKGLQEPRQDRKT